MRHRVGNYWSRAVAAWLLLVPGALAFQPVFGDARGAIPGLLGITAGTCVVLLGAWLRLTALSWGAGAVLAYYLVGGPVAAPETTVDGLWPTFSTLTRLTQLTYQGFADLLTVAAPAADLAGPQAVPLLLGLLSSVVLVGVVRSTRAVAWPMLVPVLWLGVAIALGVPTAPYATWLGLGLGIGILAWGVAHRAAAMGAANATFLVARPQGMSRRTWQLLSAGIVIVVAGGAAVGVTALTAEGMQRRVLREFVAPPLNLSDYPSPLVKYRFYSLNQAEEVLFSVDNPPPGGRLRLAVLDQWNGEVFNVSPDAGRYLRVGRKLPWQPQGEQLTSTVTAGAYDGVWVPSFGQPGRIEFVGPNAAEQGRGLYVNELSHQALTTAGFTPGSTVTSTAEPSIPLTGAQREAIADAGVGQAPLAEVERIPEVLSQHAVTWTAGATSAYDALARLEDRLRTMGYYSNGAEENSRAGHSAERLAYMFNQDQWVGDDEQFATAMSLMATSRGIPTRVVMGFYPAADVPPGETWHVTGADAHVWVEANLAGVGWVSFDPTPTRTANVETPDPKPKPKPRVDPPPAPPEHLQQDTVTAEEEPVDIDDDDEQTRDSSPTLAVLGAVAGGLLLVATPLALIAWYKAARLRRRRRAADPTAQVAGAWDELVDRARDMGYVPLPDMTRRESAALLENRHAGISVTPLAGDVDRFVYGHEQPDESTREAIWISADSLKRSLLSTRPWYARPVTIFSWKSLRRPPTHRRPPARPQPSTKAGRTAERRSR